MTSTPYPARARNRPRQSSQSMSCEPMTGARMGASPVTSARRDSIRTRGCPPNRSRTVAIATTPPPAAPTPCSTRKTSTHVMSGANATPRARPDMDRRGDEERELATDLVAPRAEDELPDAEADHRRREGQLDRRLVGPELLGDDGEGQQVEVDRERPEADEQAERDDVQHAGAERERVAGVGERDRDGLGEAMADSRRGRRGGPPAPSVTWSRVPELGHDGERAHGNVPNPEMAGGPR